MARLLTKAAVALAALTPIHAAAPCPTQPAELTPARKLEHSINAGATCHFRIALEKNQTAQVRILQIGIDVGAAVRDAANAIVHRSDWRSTGAETATWTASQTGAYTLEIAARRPRGISGEIHLDLTLIQGDAPSLARRTAAEKASTALKDELGKGTGHTKLAPAIEEAAELWRQLDHPPGIAQTLHFACEVEIRAGLVVKAQEHCAEAMRLRQSEGDLAGQVETMLGQGAAESASGQKAKAADLYRQALEVARQVGRVEGVSTALSNLGAVYLALGRTDEAIAVMAEAVSTAQLLGDNRLEVLARINLGATHAVVSETDDAFLQFRLARNLARSSGDKRGEAYALVSLGYLYLAFADYRAGKAVLRQAVQLFREIEESRAWAAAQVSLGVNHIMSGDPNSAIRLISEAKAAFTQIGDRHSEATAWDRLARAHHAVGNREQAAAATAKAIEMSRSLGDSRGEAAALRGLGEIERAAGNLKPAREALQTSARLFAGVRYPDGEADALLALAKLDHSENNIPAALDSITQALALIESQRSRVTPGRSRGGYFASKRDYYEFAIDLFMTRARDQPGGEDAARALELSDRARARLLLDTVALSRIQARATPELDARRRQLLRSINQLARQLQETPLPKAAADQAHKRLDSLLAELDELQGRLAAQDPRYADLVSPPPLRLREIQAELDDGTLLIEYFLAEDRGYVWAVTHDSLWSSSALPPRAEIETLVRRFSESVRVRPASRAAGDFSPAAAQLSRALLDPLAGRLNARRIVFVADGALHHLPFAALPAGSRAGAPPLISRFEIVQVPSASVLATLRKAVAGRASPSSTVAVVADPVYSATDSRLAAAASAIAQAATATRGESETDAANTHDPLEEAATRGTSNFSRLLFSRLEANAILDRTPAASRQAYVDFDANLDTVKDPRLANARFLHFAVHGYLDNARPSLSALALSSVDRNGAPRDGFLRLHDIYNLRLLADTVTLSACQTAIGQEIRGEGLASLTRGFLHAGASRVVATLWQVDDEATAELMKSYYAGMLGARLKPAAALRRAQLSLARGSRWAHPYYWAGFVAVGDWR